MHHRNSRHGRVAAGLVVLGALAVPPPAEAQDLREALSLLASENARRYVRPVTEALGSTLNSGFLYTARTHQPLGFDVGVHVLGSFVADSDDFFVPVLPDSVVVDGLVLREPYAGASGTETPTAFGSGTGILLTPQNEYRALLEARGIDPASRNLRFPSGFDFSTAPFAFIQIGVGVGFGTDAAIRFIPKLTLRDDVGAVSMIGFGLKHSIDQWFADTSAVAVAVFGNIHSLSTGDYAHVTAGQVGLAASTDVGTFTVLGALAYEDTRVNVDYVIRNPSDLPGRPPDGTELSFDDSADRHLRATLGLALRLGVVRLSVNASVGPYTTLDGALIFTYR